jgi:hypothetical protein
MKISLEELRNLVKKTLKESQYTNDEEYDYRDEKEILYDLIRVINKINLIDSDVVAQEIATNIINDLNHENMPQKEVLERFANRVGQQINDRLNKLHRIDRELSSILETMNKGIENKEDINF